MILLHEIVLRFQNMNTDAFHESVSSGIVHKVDQSLSWFPIKKLLKAV